MPKVRVLSEDGTQVGIFTIKDALRMAGEKALDLVEIAPKAEPPVCKIIDFGKFKYEQQKRDKTQRKGQHVSVLKEIRLHPNTDVHDFDFKVKHAIGFLEDGNKVKVVVMFKGRELAYLNKGEVLLTRFAERVELYAKIESAIKMEGRNMSIIVVPQKVKKKAN